VRRDCPGENGFFEVEGEGKAWKKDGRRRWWLWLWNVERPAKVDHACVAGEGSRDYDRLNL